jgi:hypothetical protein
MMTKCVLTTTFYQRAAGWLPLPVSVNTSKHIGTGKCPKVFVNQATLWDLLEWTSQDDWQNHQQGRFTQDQPSHASHVTLIPFPSSSDHTTVPNSFVFTLHLSQKPGQGNVGTAMTKPGANVFQNIQTATCIPITFQIKWLSPALKNEFTSLSLKAHEHIRVCFHLSILQIAYCRRILLEPVRVMLRIRIIPAEFHFRRQN